MNKNIEIETTRKDLTHAGGLFFFKNIADRLNIEGFLGSVLPSRVRKSRIPGKLKFMTGVYAFILGADCIEDLNSLKQDPLLEM